MQTKRIIFHHVIPFLCYVFLWSKRLKLSISVFCNHIVFYFLLYSIPVFLLYCFGLLYSKQVIPNPMPFKVIDTLYMNLFWFRLQRILSICFLLHFQPKWLDILLLFLSYVCRRNNYWPPRVNTLPSTTTLYRPQAHLQGQGHDHQGKDTAVQGRCYLCSKCERLFDKGSISVKIVLVSTCLVEQFYLAPASLVRWMLGKTFFHWVHFIHRTMCHWVYSFITRSLSPPRISLFLPHLSPGYLLPSQSTWLHGHQPSSIGLLH